jgi:hypothetical protein
MAANINDYVASVRIDLDDAAKAIWSDADLQRHVTHAAIEYQIWRPLEVLDTAHSLTAGSRTISIADIPALMRVTAVEYPTGQWPPAYVQFQQWGTALTLFLDGAPAPSDPLAVNLYTLQRHTLTTSACTIDPADDEAIVAGAVHFAALEYSFLTAGRVNAAGPNTWQRYRDLAVDKGAEFRDYLTNVRARVTPNRLYAPSEPRMSRYSVEAPWRT